MNDLQTENKIALSPIALCKRTWQIFSMNYYWRMLGTFLFILLIIMLTAAATAVVLVVILSLLGLMPTKGSSPADALPLIISALIVFVCYYIFVFLPYLYSLVEYQMQWAEQRSEISYINCLKSVYARGASLFINTLLLMLLIAGTRIVAEIFLTPIFGPGQLSHGLALLIYYLIILLLSMTVPLYLRTNVGQTSFIESVKLVSRNFWKVLLNGSIFPIAATLPVILIIATLAWLANAAFGSSVAIAIIVIAYIGILSLLPLMTLYGAVFLLRMLEEYRRQNASLFR